MLLRAPSPAFYSGGLVSPWVLSHWDTIKHATVAAVVTYPLVLSLAIMQVRLAPYTIAYRDAQVFPALRVLSASIMRS